MAERLGISKEAGSLLVAAALGFAAKKAPVRLDLDDGDSVDVDAQDATSVFAMQAMDLTRAVVGQLAPRRKRPSPKKLPAKRKAKR